MTPQHRAYLVALGQHIRKLRTQRKLSQEALALMAGIDRTYVSSVERGLRNISVVNLRRLSESLRVHPRQMLDF